MKKVTGIGGIFFKTKDRAKTLEWYKNHLGINSEDWGATFHWLEKHDSKKEGSTAWSPFKDSTDYFAPSEKPFMINYRVENLDELLNQKKKEGGDGCGRTRCAGRVRQVRLDNGPGRK